MTDAYGVGAPIIGVRRSVFVVDGGGIVRYTDRKLIGATFVPADKLVPVLEVARLIVLASLMSDGAGAGSASVVGCESGSAS